MRRLRIGEKFVMPGEREPWEVLRVTECAATVRPTKKNYVNYDTLGDEPVEYHANARGIEISAYSVVRRLEDDGLDQQSAQLVSD